MQETDFKNISKALETGGPYQQEGDVTVEIAREVCSWGTGTSLWMSTQLSASVPGSGARHRGWRVGAVGRVYDLAWSLGASQIPDVVMQVKRKNSTPVSSKVLLYLSDVLWAALDQRNSKSSYSVLYYEHGQLSDLYWPRLLACSPKATLVLDPASVPDTTGNSPTWIDFATKRIRPASKRQLNQVFGGGTNSKYVGLWRRPGTLEVDVDIKWHATSTTRILVTTPQAVRLQGAQVTVDEWFP